MNRHRDEKGILGKEKSNKQEIEELGMDIGNELT